MEAEINIFSVNGSEATGHANNGLANFDRKMFLLKIALNLDKKIVNIERLQTIVEENSKGTVRELVKQFNTSHTVIIKLLHDL